MQESRSRSRKVNQLLRHEMSRFNYRHDRGAHETETETPAVTTVPSIHRIYKSSDA